MHMSVVIPRGGGGGLNIPTGFDISPSKFGQFFHPGAKFLYKLPHPREIPKISKQNNFKNSKLISQILHGSNHIQITSSDLLADSAKKKSRYVYLT